MIAFPDYRDRLWYPGLSSVLVSIAFPFAFPCLGVFPFFFTYHWILFVHFWRWPTTNLLYPGFGPAQGHSVPWGGVICRSWLVIIFLYKIFLWTYPDDFSCVYVVGFVRFHAESWSGCNACVVGCHGEGVLQLEQVTMYLVAHTCIVVCVLAFLPHVKKDYRYSPNSSLLASFFHWQCTSWVGFGCRENFIEEFY